MYGVFVIIHVVYNAEFTTLARYPTCCLPVVGRVEEGPFLMLFSMLNKRNVAATRSGFQPDVFGKGIAHHAAPWAGFQALKFAADGINV